MKQNGKWQGREQLSGVVMLAVGMVLVTLSGIALATTVWTELSPAEKTGLVAGSAVFFFAAGILAEKVFGIRRTGAALHILGSVFLFLTAVAADHYGFLSLLPDFLRGQECFIKNVGWGPMFLGGGAAAAALALRYRSLPSRFYKVVCLIAISVDVWFFLEFLGADYPVLPSVMAGYAAALAVCGRFRGTVFAAFFEILLALCVISLLPQVMVGCLMDLFGHSFRTVLRDNAASVFAAVLAAAVFEAAAYKRGGEARRTLSRVWTVIAIHYAVILLPFGHTGKLALVSALLCAAQFLPYFRRTRSLPGTVFLEMVLLADVLLFALSLDGDLQGLPEALSCAVSLVPVVLYSCQLRLAWKDFPGIRVLQIVMEMLCLLVLSCAALGGGFADFLVLETLCTAAFLLAQAARSLWWTRVLGVWITGAAFYTSRDFWMRFSWWMYLFLAGLTLIGIASYREFGRKGRKDEL